MRRLDLSHGTKRLGHRSRVGAGTVVVNESRSSNSPFGTIRNRHSDRFIAKRSIATSWANRFFADFFDFFRAARTSGAKSIVSDSDAARVVDRVPSDENSDVGEVAGGTPPADVDTGVEMPAGPNCWTTSGPPPDG